MDYLVHWVLNESYLCWCCSPPLLYHVATVMKKEEVWKWHRNIVIWSLTLVEAGRLFR